MSHHVIIITCLYFRFVMIFVLMSCFGGCSYWRRRQLLLAQQHHAMLHTAGYNELFGRHLGRLRSFRSRSVPRPSIPIYANYDTSFPRLASTLSRNATSMTGGRPEGHFPEPPPYSEVSLNFGVIVTAYERDISDTRHWSIFSIQH